MAENQHPIPAAPAPQSPTATVVVPDHELIRLIGRGSYGEVWLARSTLGTFRAVKLVFASHFRNLRPFEREFNGVKKFEPLSRLHDGLMDVLQVGRNDAAGYFYYVMELADDAVSGQTIDPDQYRPRTLAHEITNCKRLPALECRRIGIAIASALDFLHRHALIHRDVKPSNIVFVKGIPKLADIGLVTEMSEARSYVGTEGFIPPEGPGTAQSDIYSLGKVLYEISTGKDRHDYPELPTELDDTTQEEPILECNHIVLKACRNDPRQRYRSAAAMLADLRSFERRKSWTFRAQRWLSVSASAAVAFGALWFAGYEWRNHRDTSAAFLGRPGLVGYWAGEDDAMDGARSQDGQDREISYVPGQVGKAFWFNTSNSEVRIEASPAVDVGAGPGFTLEAWIKPMNVEVRGPLFEWNDANGIWGAHFMVDPVWKSNDFRPGALYANLVDREFNWHRINTPAGVLRTNVYQHVALTYNKNTGVAVIYCNGGMVAEKPLGRFTPLTSYDLYLGRRASAEALDDMPTFVGMIDEPAIYNRALSSTEILEDYRAGRAGQNLVLPACAPAPKGIVSWWRADRNGVDSVGGHDGVLMSETTYTIGKVGQGFNFVGTTNSYVVVPDAPALRLTNELSIEFWLKRQKPFGADYFINKGGDWSGKQLNYAVGITQPKLKNLLVFAFAGGSRSACPISDMKWHHCVVTARNGDVDPVFYVDGVRQAVTEHNGAPKIVLYPSTDPLLIGAQVDLRSGYSYYSRLAVDEMSLYGRILSPSDVQAIWNAGRAGKSIGFDGQLQTRRTEPPAEASRPR